MKKIRKKRNSEWPPSIINADLLNTARASKMAPLQACTGFGIVAQAACYTIKSACVACHTGGCCSLQISVHPAEVLLLVAGLNLEARKSLLERADYMNDLATEETAMGDRYRRLSKPCVFLSSERKCLVYQTKPLSCSRYMLAEESDRSICSIEGGEVPVALPDVMIASFVLHSFYLDSWLWGGGQHTGGTLRAPGLHATLLWALGMTDRLNHLDWLSIDPRRSSYRSTDGGISWAKALSTPHG